MLVCGGYKNHPVVRVIHPPIDSILLLYSNFKRVRKARGIKASELAQKARRSRNTLYRLENGEEITTGAFLDFLSAMGCTISIESLGLPTLEEMQKRFHSEEFDD